MAEVEKEGPIGAPEDGAIIMPLLTLPTLRFEIAAGGGALANISVRCLFADVGVAAEVMSGTRKERHKRYTR
jgi:hypothetical protein